MSTEKQKCGDVTASHQVLLHVFPPKFGLPSFDYDSLAILTYCKFGNGAVALKSDGFSRLGFLSNKEPIPSLRSANKHAATVEESFDLLRELKYGVDFHLSDKDSADALAFIELMECRLRPAVMHTYWLEKGNYEQVTRETYATAFPLPATIFQPRCRQLDAKEFVFTSEGGSLNAMRTTDVETKIYRDAACCLNDLSDKLGSQPYLFGKMPTTADAVMYGYLAPILMIPFPKNRLKGQLENYTNLCNTIQLIKKMYCTVTTTDSVKKVEDITVTAIDDKEFPHQTRNTFIAAVFGLTVMVTYILLRGIISIHIEDEDMD